MLKLVIPEREYFDEEAGEHGEFITKPSVTLELEHSLVSLSAWESKWEKPFLGKEKTTEETFDYIRLMTLNIDSVDEDVFNEERLTPALLEQVNTYLTAKMTATWFTEKPGQGKGPQKIITAEILYHYMIAANIPAEYQYWHLNRLLTLIRVINQENNPGKKMSKSEMAQRNRELNAQRRAQLGTRG